LLKKTGCSGGKTAAFNSDRFGIFTVGKSALVISDFNSGEGLGPQDRCSRVHYDDNRIADIGKILEQCQEGCVLCRLRDINRRVKENFFFILLL